MRRTAKILSFICLGCMIIAAILTAKELPPDPGSYVEKKYSGWSGVLRGWIFSEWSCSGNFTSWLNRAAAEFEKQHEGVYLEFESVNREAMQAGDIHPPDMLIFSQGAVEAEGRAIATGGYIFVENPSAKGTAIPAEYAAPLIAMYEDIPMELPDSGMDLGLPASATIEPIEIADDAFRRFMNGELGRTIVNQAQLAKLIALRESGRGPDWHCTVQGRFCWQDQLLMLGIQAEDARKELCESFLELLLSNEQQAALASIGAFPVTGVSAYDGFSAYLPMEQQLRSATPVFPKSEHSAAFAEALVRKLSSGAISAEDAAHQLVQTCS